MAPCRRRRHRRLEMAAEDQLSDPGRRDADRRRPGVLWRRRRKLLCGRCRQRPEAVGSKDRRRDRRRRHHLYGERRAESRGGDRLHISALAGSDRDREGRDPRRRGWRHALMKEDWKRTFAFETKIPEEERTYRCQTQTTLL